MKKIDILVVFITSILFILIGCKKESVTITGSETMYPMLKILVEDYNRYQDGIEATISGGGSKLGLKKLIKNQIDIAASSLDIQKAFSKHLTPDDLFEIVIIAFDGIAIVASDHNPIYRLHLKQISDIFAGRITNWKDVGGLNMKIKVLIRNDNSGTANYMKEHILRQKDLGKSFYEKYKYQSYAKNARVVKNNREMAEVIYYNMNAIGYMGMGSAETEGKGKVKKLKYAITKEGHFYKPTAKTVEKQQYKLSRPLMLLYRSDKGGKKDKFIDYVKSDRAHKKVLSSGYLDSLYSKIMLKTLSISGKKSD